MSDDHPTDLILRTVYLPKEVDRELKGVAFRSERSKNALIRDLIVEAIKARRDRGDPLFTNTPQREPVAAVAAKPKRVTSLKSRAIHARTKKVDSKKAARA
jgi:hypothetical protein